MVILSPSGDRFSVSRMREIYYVWNKAISEEDKYLTKQYLLPALKYNFRHVPFRYSLWLNQYSPKHTELYKHWGNKTCSEKIHKIWLNRYILRWENYHLTNKNKFTIMLLWWNRGGGLSTTNLPRLVLR